MGVTRAQLTPDDVALELDRMRPMVIAAKLRDFPAIPRAELENAYGDITLDALKRSFASVTELARFVHEGLRHDALDIAKSAAFRNTSSLTEMIASTDSPEHRVLEHEARELLHEFLAELSDASGRALGSGIGPRTRRGPRARGRALMPAGLTANDSMFSVREKPWHGLGVVLERSPVTIAEAIELSGLGWRVEREPIAVDRGDAATVDDWWEPRCEEISGYWANVRQDTRQVLGIVGDRYRIVQNIEAFQFVDQLIGSAMHFETAGSLHDGRKVWVLARLPEHVEIGGDPVRCYVLLMNSHDGSTAVVAASTPVRVVCQNTLNWGLARAHQRYSIRHTDKIREHVHQARQVLDISVDYYQQFKYVGDQLASQRISEVQMCRVLDELYPTGTADVVTGLGARASRSSSGSPSYSCTATPRATRPDRSGRR